MSGTPAVTALLAHVVFWILLAYGALTGELRPSRAVVFASSFGKRETGFRVLERGR